MVEPPPPSAPTGDPDSVPEPVAGHGSDQPPGPLAPPWRPGAHRTRSILGLALAAAAVVVLAVVVGTRPAGSTATASPGAGRSAGSPLIALVDGSGALVAVDPGGASTVLGAGSGVTYGFPAWSPDGSRVAAVVYSADEASIAIFPVRRGEPRPSQPPAPTIVYRSGAIPPFYLYWTPDGEHVSFLATEADGLSLRVAPADGSAPLDGGPGTVIRQGAPLYFDWLGADRILVHIGVGSAAFLGEVGLDGVAIGPTLDGSGDFRPAVAGAGARFIAWVRGAAATSTLVVAGRDGSAEHTIPVFGPAAIAFDPSGATVATNAGTEPSQAALGFPSGPLRLVDAATGTARTLIDGTIVGFFWSPDGRTIAALRLQAAGSGGTVADRSIVAAAAFAAASPVGSSSPGPTPGPSVDASTEPTPGPTGGSELHLLFVDVADGTVRSDRVVRLTSHFINQFLPYFDQYALSHRVWSPDSRSLLIPLVDATGRDRLTALPADSGEAPHPYDGDIGFWSP
jgi:TolB protein